MVDGLIARKAGGRQPLGFLKLAEGISGLGIELTCALVRREKTLGVEPLLNLFLATVMHEAPGGARHRGARLGSDLVVGFGGRHGRGRGGNVGMDTAIGRRENGGGG